MQININSSVKQQSSGRANLGQVQQQLQLLQDKGQNLASVMVEIANQLLDTTEIAFENETSQNKFITL
jgi:hypothetical protein